MQNIYKFGGIRSYCTTPFKSKVHGLVSNANNNNNNKSTESLIINSRNLLFHGRQLLERGDLDQAEKMIVHSFRNFNKKIDIHSSLFAVPSHAVGLVSLKKGKYSKGEQFFKLSLDRSETDSSYVYRNSIETSNDLGLSLLRQGKTQESFEQLQKALNLALEYQMYSLVASIYTNLGEYYKDMCYYDKSKFYHGIAHSRLMTYSSPGLDMARCFLNRSQISRISGEMDQSKEFLLEGSGILIRYLKRMGYSSNLPKHMDWAKTLIEFGHYYYKMGNIDKAKKKLNSAKKLFEEMNIKSIPDSVINTLNLAIIEKNIQLAPATSAADQQKIETHIQNLLAEIQKPYKDLQLEKFNPKLNRFNNVFDNLKNQKCQKPIPLIENLHFQLSGMINF
ncbi:hypothetical protein CYY_000043 [Polysphondylium violaceum]|uniref:Tetratricopeptide-like helical domain-containing protein n=1 Tax=Polysphondylium violaceum TaxID=133409 RepID=A0A8J4Q5F6_9MYCE|nr:hypothetical protein CYY_000043 [Polysphondylium violaceum]